LEFSISTAFLRPTIRSPPIRINPAGVRLRRKKGDTALGFRMTACQDGIASLQ